MAAAIMMGMVIASRMLSGVMVISASSGDGGAWSNSKYRQASHTCQEKNIPCSVQQYVKGFDVSLEQSPRWWMRSAG